MLPYNPSASLKRSISTPNTLSALRSNNFIEDDPYSDSRTKQLTLSNKYGPATNLTNRIFSETSPEELAKQLTLIDWEIFSRITKKELTPGQWTGPMKHTLSQNVVAFTRRFNILTYWISDEILSLITAKKRAEVLGYFIRACTCLIEIRSLYSAFAIFCALTSEPIHRLQKTWDLLNKKEKLSFEKISFLFSQAENSSALRDFMNKSLKATPPNCIPNFSIFLRDIIHIHTYYPDSDPKSSEERNKKLETIHSLIRKCQQSNFDHIHIVEHVYDYLNSFDYIEELQKFREDDYYNRSIKLEPPEDKNSDSTTTINKSKFYYGRFNSNYDISSSASPSSVSASPSKHGLQPFFDELKRENLAKSLNESLFQDSNPKDRKAFKPGHRKTNSLEMGALNGSKNSSIVPKQNTLSTGKTLHVNLIDDSPAFDVFAAHLQHDNHCSRKPHLEVVQQNRREEDDSSSIEDDPKIKNYYSEHDFLCHGPISRKTTLKIGKKPSLPFWTNYYLGLTNESLLFFNIKQVGSSKLKPIKRLCLLDWTVAYSDDNSGSDKCNIFTLVDRNCTTIYKIRSTNEATTKEWIQTIRKVTSKLKSFYI